MDSVIRKGPLPYISLLLAYISAHVFLFLNPGLFWDDWTIFGVSPESILQTFENGGSPFNWFAHYHNYVQSTSSPVWVYRTVVGIEYFVAGLSLLGVLTRLDSLSFKERYLICLLFLVLPFNSARISVINSGYALCYMCFFLGWYVLSYSGQRNHKTITAISFLPLLFSYNTASLLPFVFFTIVPYLFYLTRKEEDRNSWSSDVRVFLFRHWPTLLAPFLFFYAKNKVSLLKDCLPVILRYVRTT